jgi:TolB-like protein/class 3 adenylate cyclase
MAAPRVDRRLAAILAADVVGYSRLMGRDEQGTLDRLKAHRKELVEPLVAEHGGRIVKLMGDGILCEFPSAVDAVRCAVLVQQGMAEREADAPEEQKIHLRIGINVGDIIHEPDGDIYGDGVNVAARLQTLAEPSGVLLAGNVHAQVKDKLPFRFEPTGRHRIKNIAEPVEAWRVLADGAMRHRRVRVPRPHWAAAAAATMMAVLVLLGGGWWLWPGGQTPAGKASVAVLPFDNLGGDEPTGRLADGITEDIITDLARFRDLDVIARNSTAVYKGKPVDVRQIGKELGVGYVLEGSIQRQGDSARVTAQLIDTRTGAHAWSERWDRPLADVFAVQSEIAERVAGSLGGGMSFAAITANEAQRAKRRPPASLSAYEHYLLATEAKAQQTEPLVRKGLEHAEAAIALDPNLARAYTARGWLRYFAISFGADYATSFQEMGADFRKAVELDPLDAEARAALANWLQEAGNFPEAVAEVRKAVSMSPSNGHVLVTAASLLAFAGEVEEALTAADRAVRLDPRMPPGLLRGVKDAFFLAREFERTIDAVLRMPEDGRSRGSVFMLAVSYAFLGREREAEAAKAVFVARYGSVSAELWLNQGFVFGRERERDLFVESFRKLGLPVCAGEEELKTVAKPTRLPECEAKRAKMAGPKT